MGRRQQRKKTRKVKRAESEDLRVESKEQGGRMVACGKRINGIEERKVDYNSLSSTGKAALDNVIYLTGRTRDELLEG